MKTHGDLLGVSHCQRHPNIILLALCIYIYTYYYIYIYLYYVYIYIMYIYIIIYIYIILIYIYYININIYIYIYTYPLKYPIMCQFYLRYRRTTHGWNPFKIQSSQLFLAKFQFLCQELIITNCFNNTIIIYISTQYKNTTSKWIKIDQDSKKW